jgi:hypothetical protein
MKEPNWKYSETKTKRINVLDIDFEHHEVDALDMEAFLPFTLDVVDDVLLEEIEKGQNYNATFKVFTAKMRPEDEKGMADVTEPEIMEKIKALGGDLFKFELVSVEEA